MTKTTKKSNSPKHYYLVSGEVLFIDPNNQDSGVGTTRLNATVVTEKPHVSVKDIGRAQQALQVNLHNRIGEQKFQVIDVVVLSLSYLGKMTEAEFNPPATPAANDPFTEQ